MILGINPNDIAFDATNVIQSLFLANTSPKLRINALISTFKKKVLSLQGVGFEPTQDLTHEKTR